MLLVLAACGDATVLPESQPQPEPVSCDPVSALTLCGGYSTWECEWGRLWAASGSTATFREFMVGDDPDARLRSLFPAIGDKPIVDVDVAIPAGSSYNIPGFDAYALPSTIDWYADPHANATWRQYFQSLELRYFTTPGDVFDLGAGLVVAWHDQVLYDGAPPDYTWGNSAAAIRLTNTSAAMDRYIANRDVLSRKVLQAAAEIIVTHLYMLATDACYAPQHNHGMMQDIALLETARKFPGLGADELLWNLAQSRALAQAQFGVSSDGLHVENTSTYHHFFLTLLNDVIRAHQHAGAQVPETLIALRDSMFEPMVQQLQPDLSFPLFGDTNELDSTPYFQAMIAATDELGVGDPAKRATLDWIVSGGAKGVVPENDVVYEHSGYAVFRDRWTADAASLHFKTGHLGGGHYRPDETGIEFFAHGIALVEQVGLYSYEEPFLSYQQSPAAQNVLVVDGISAVSEEANPASRVVAHGESALGPWVQGTHESFAPFGVDRLVRTVVFAKPDVVILVDHVRAGGEHEYSQHFHLHPSLDQLTRVNDRTVSVTGAGGPTLTIAAGFQPQQIATDRGVIDGSTLKGWYFPKFLQMQPAYDVVLERRGRSVDSAVVLAAAAPGQPATTIEGVSLSSNSTSFTVSWVQNGSSRRVSFPRPR